ncbi:MAG: hypothetical protein LBP60_09645 [Spirochaetaceae bacterium]|jgi:predicted LPLAT superfamily acyltransferase|nr:hypothetical protein [Spirochaetaceae bacterium]
MKRAGPEGASGEHWSKQKEKARFWQMELLFFLFRLLPPPLLSLLAYPVGLGYFLFSKKSRVESRRFLDRLAAFRKHTGTAWAAGRPGRKRLSALGHISAFALTVVEKAQAWRGNIPFKRIHFQDDDIKSLINGLEQGRGAVLLCSHLGNTELLRALADYHRTGVSRDIPVTSIVDFEVTPFFNRMMAKLNHRALLKIISANSIGPDSIVALQEETDRGGLAVIAGDRTPAHTRGRFFSIPFLGAEAPFPQGPWLLGALLEAPVYAVFALRRKDLSPAPDYDMHVHRLQDPAPQEPPRNSQGPQDGGAFAEDREKAAAGSGAEYSGPSRKERTRLMEGRARQFAALLEGYCLQHPYQWYNFYNFWAAEGSRNGDADGQH